MRPRCTTSCAGRSIPLAGPGSTGCSSPPDTGHGIGVTTHEPPYLVEGEAQPLLPGMCFSIEPGIYLPGRFGVRIEDIVVATDDGARRLNGTSRELRIVG